MKNLTAGIIAGLIATLVLSLLMMLKGMMGVMLDLDVITMLSAMMGTTAAIGWIIHFMIGAGYGAAFVPLEGVLPGSVIVKGIVLATVGWIMMMIVVMPMAGSGLFAVNMGVMAPVATLMLHVIFGAGLGFSYARLRNR